MTDEIKKIHERLDRLEKMVFSKIVHGTENHGTKQPNYTSNDRAFIKNNSSKQFSGQEYFTLICAYLAKGKQDHPVKLNDIKGVWKRCAGVMGNLPYSSIYSTRAKENEWVNTTTERGVYMLGKRWAEILKNV